jgi:hypothetical protein
MKRTTGLLAKVFILVLAVVLLVSGVTACGKTSTTTTTTTTGAKYKLVHNLPDLEYVLPWDTIAARCPDINDCTKYQKEEAYMGRGNAGGFISLDSNSPAMWMIARVVNKITEGNSVRNLSVFMWYFDTEKEFDEHMNTLRTQGISVQKDGEFITAVVEQKTPVQTAQLVVAGNSLCIVIADAASPDESLIFGKEDLTEMLPTIKSKIASIEITPLPYPRIPRK